MADKIVFKNARIFIDDETDLSSAEAPRCLIVEDKTIAHVGHENDGAVQQAIRDGAQVKDVENQLIAPAFIDAHTHLLFFGLSLQKLDLYSCKSLSDIRRSITEYAKRNPSIPRILCRGWQQCSTNGEALATMIDDLDLRPIIIEANDLHSCWLNTAALKELPQVDQMRAVAGDLVSVDKDGNPTGLLAETAVTAFIWPHLMNAATVEDKQAALDQAFNAYVNDGYAGAIDMAMDAPTWGALKRYKSTKGLPIHIAAHWFIPYEESDPHLDSHLEEAIAMHKETSKDPEFCVVGVKLIADGVVDGCTAALSHPYGGRTELVKPLWPSDAMNRAVKRATEAGLQVAIHAIGDAAVTQAIDAIAAANQPEGRHRIEHLEVTTEADAKRLGKLGITASIQPVHSDPDILRAYPHLTGPHSWKRAFAYREFAEGNAPIALGTDAPTARHYPFPNLYNATTRKSATDTSLESRTNPHNGLSLPKAAAAATAGAAYSRFAETWTGSLRKGLRADLVVLDAEWTPESLLQAKVIETWIGGSLAYQRSKVTSYL